MRATLKITVWLLGGWCMGAVTSCGWLTTPTKSTIWLNDREALKKAEDAAPVDLKVDGATVRQEVASDDDHGSS